MYQNLKTPAVEYLEHEKLFNQKQHLKNGSHRQKIEIAKKFAE